MNDIEGRITENESEKMSSNSARTTKTQKDAAISKMQQKRTFHYYFDS